MSSLYWAKRLFSLDTLDTRFTVSATTPLKAADASKTVPNGLSKNQSEGARSIATSAKPSLWLTSEYVFYVIWVIIAVACMVYTPYSVSKTSDPRYPQIEPLLSEGWIPGRKVDNSDMQYASFRNNIPAMALLLILHPILRRVYNAVFPLATNVQSKSESQAEARLKQRISYDLYFAIVLIFSLHGFSALKVLSILYLNFCIGTTLPREAIPWVTWPFNLAVMFGNELYKGYSYASIAKAAFAPDFIQAFASQLDGFGGIIPRWEVLFNLTILRMIAFNMDYYWSLIYRGDSPVEKKQLSPESLSERDRVSIPAARSTFRFSYYLAYTLYSPLYLTGPIINFNDYIHQLKYPSPSVTRSRTLLYGIRFLAALLTMELLLHYMYVVAISKSSPDWSTYTPFQLSMLGFFNLHIIWLKLLLPWRFFRLWALCDGIDPPENMVRCMSNNYSTLAFWRGWHRSFNRWIVRYIYVPLGGSGKGTSMVRTLVNYGAVFTFVALWHDISATLLMWSWLVILFFVPELFCSTVLFPARKFKDHPNTFRYLCGLGAVGNIMMMMAANLVGFAIGLDGLKGLVHNAISGFWGWLFLAAASATLFVGSMVMFEIRESEKRRGINLKC